MLNVRHDNSALARDKSRARKQVNFNFNIIQKRFAVRVGEVRGRRVRVGGDGYEGIADSSLSVLGVLCKSLVLRLLIF